MKTVFSKTLFDKRWFVVGWFFGLLALAGLLVIFYPSMHQQGSLDTLLKSMPPAMQGFIGDLSNLQHFDTYLASQLFDIRMQILVGVMVVVLALGLTVAEEEKGQLRTLLSLPVSRTSVLFQKWVAMELIIALTLLGTVVGILLFQLTIHESVDLLVLLRLIIMTWLTMSVFATITFAAGMATGLRPVATLLGIFTLAGSFVLSTFSVGVDWLKDYEHLSLFYYFPAVDIAKHSIDLGDVMVLVGIIAIALFTAFVDFRHRDVK